MSSKRGPAPHVRSIVARLGNAHRELNAAGGGKMTRSEVFTLYAIERILYRIGRSPYARQFVLKGGVLAGALFDSPFRATRDADLLGPGARPSVRRIRGVFDAIAAMDTRGQDAVEVTRVRARRAQEDEDGYDGVKVLLDVAIGRATVVVQVDVGFGDGVSPKPRRLLLPSLIKDDTIPPAQLYAYPLEAFVAEKVETLVSRFPAILHRLKDLVDVYVAITTSPFDALRTQQSFRRTFTSRGAGYKVGSLRALASLATDRPTRAEWAKMLKDKRVSASLPDLREVIGLIICFSEPLLIALAQEDILIGSWQPANSNWQFKEVDGES